MDARPDPTQVFVVHGRNQDSRRAVFELLRALGLLPLEFSQAIALTKKGTPTIAQILDSALAVAQAIVVLFTPDDLAQLDPQLIKDEDPDHDRFPSGQARANVIFEAGLAIGRSEDRTILLEHGRVRPFSDIAGRHVVRIGNGPDSRIDLANRLRAAGCAVRTDGTDWLRAGDFSGSSVKREQANSDDLIGQIGPDVGSSDINIKVVPNGPHRFRAELSAYTRNGVVIKSLSVHPKESYVVLAGMLLPHVLQFGEHVNVQIVQVSSKKPNEYPKLLVLT